MNKAIDIPDGRSIGPTVEQQSSSTGGAVKVSLALIFLALGIAVMASGYVLDGEALGFKLKLAPAQTRPPPPP